MKKLISFICMTMIFLSVSRTTLAHCRHLQYCIINLFHLLHSLEHQVKSEGILARHRILSRIDVSHTFRIKSREVGEGEEVLSLSIDTEASYETGLLQKS